MIKYLQKAGLSSMILNDNTYVTVDLDIILQNFNAVCDKVATDVMAVVKADAYGHGAIEVARTLEDRCAFFGVSSMQEALELRQAKIQKPILILGHTPVSAFPIIVRENIRPTIFQYADALALSAEAVRQKKTAPFHFAVDTGMSRIGFQATQKNAAICQQIAALPGLQAEGLFSHFATADCENLEKSYAQAALFRQFDRWLQDLSVQIPFRHMNNSAGLMNFTEHYAMVRAGIVMYGLYPSHEVDTTKLHIQPALSWHSRVSHIKTLPAGREISYGGAYVTTKDTVVATIPVGYADGYQRSLSNKFYVLIHGKKAPILGRICMDQMMVDITDIPDVAVEDPVVLVGTDGQETITMEAIAEAAGSFHYEFVCGISRRVPRHYRKNGRIAHSVHYLLD